MPKCPYFGNCGGCSSQHISYDLQLKNKKNAAERALQTPISDIFSGEPYNYRNRMDFIFHAGGIGLRQRNKWNRIVDIAECHISNEKLNSLLKELRDSFKGADYCDIKSRRGTFLYAVIRTTKETSSISFVLNKDSTRIAEAVEKIKEYSKAASAEHIAVTYSSPIGGDSVSEDFFMVKGSGLLSETIAGFKFSFSLQGFFQNNTAMAEKMLLYTNRILRKYNTEGSFLLDLYGGVGLFGLGNASLFKEVAVMESFKASANAALLNAAENQIGNLKIITADVKSLGRLNFPKPLFIITDPPRVGMHPKAIQAINELEPEAIVYISCNPLQLGKELPRFENYKINSAVLFEMFPQTNHMEVIVELFRG